MGEYLHIFISTPTISKEPSNHATFMDGFRYMDSSSNLVSQKSNFSINGGGAGKERRRV